MLWITFKICIFVTSNNFPIGTNRQDRVVNYFQNLYLCDFQQHLGCSLSFTLCCELLSKFVSLWFETTYWDWKWFTSKLWITFKICIFVIENNTRRGSGALAVVVNYFQNLYLCDFKQQKPLLKHTHERCELLSKFVSLWLQTTLCSFFLILI